MMQRRAKCDSRTLFFCTVGGGSYSDCSMYCTWSSGVVYWPGPGVVHGVPSNETPASCMTSVHCTESPSSPKEGAAAVMCIIVGGLGGVVFYNFWHIGKKCAITTILLFIDWARLLERCVLTLFSGSLCHEYRFLGRRLVENNALTKFSSYYWRWVVNLTVYTEHSPFYSYLYDCANKF